MDTAQPILIVDDSLAIANQLAAQLNALADCATTIHTRPLLALDEVRADPGRYRLAFIDLHMPELDGMALMRAMGEAGFSGDVVIISALDRSVLDFAHQIAKGYPLKLLGTLSKPIQEAELAQLLLRTERRPSAPPR